MVCQNKNGHKVKSSALGCVPPQSRGLFSVRPGLSAPQSLPALASSAPHPHPHPPLLSDLRLLSCLQGMISQTLANKVHLKTVSYGVLIVWVLQRLLTETSWLIKVKLFCPQAPGRPREPGPQTRKHMERVGIILGQEKPVRCDKRHTHL